MVDHVAQRVGAVGGGDEALPVVPAAERRLAFGHRRRGVDDDEVVDLSQHVVGDPRRPERRQHRRDLRFASGAAARRVAVPGRCQPAGEVPGAAAGQWSVGRHGPLGCQFVAVVDVLDRRRPHAQPAGARPHRRHAQRPRHLDARVVGAAEAGVESGAVEGEHLLGRAERGEVGRSRSVPVVGERARGPRLEQGVLDRCHRQPLVRRLAPERRRRHRTSAARRPVARWRSPGCGTARTSAGAVRRSSGTDRRVARAGPAPGSRRRCPTRSSRGSRR